MKATLINKYRYDLDNGNLIEMIIWNVPEPVVGSKHSYKYRLFFGNNEKRIIGYDNERPKGDHRHYGEHEEFYRFSTIEQLVKDFFNDVEQWESQAENR